MFGVTSLSIGKVNLEKFVATLFSFWLLFQVLTSKGCWTGAARQLTSKKKTPHEEQKLSHQNYCIFSTLYKHARSVQKAILGHLESLTSASRKKGLILGRLRPFQFPQKGHLH